MESIRQCLACPLSTLLDSLHMSLTPWKISSFEAQANFSMQAKGQFWKHSNSFTTKVAWTFKGQRMGPKGSKMALKGLKDSSRVQKGQSD